MTSPEITPHGAPEPVALRLLINGAWREGLGPLLSSTDPAQPGTVVAHGTQAVPADVDEAVAAARAASGDWARMPLHERGEILLRAAAALEADAPSLGAELTREEGKTLAEGVGEVRRAVQILRYFGNSGDRSVGEVYASPRAGEQILVTHKPLGVVGIVTPFNFPIAIPAWKIAPALVYGNTVVWKPASAVPLLAMRLAEALQEAGLPAGVLNLLVGPGALGNTIVEHSDLDGFTFTGSTGIGRMLATKAAARGIPMQAEMGGKNAAVVLDDADLDLAVDQVLLGAFRSAGQKCTATSRVIVTEAVADTFLEKLLARLEDWKVGDPLNPAMQMGPVVSEQAADEIRAGIARALAEGARLAFSGTVDGGALASGASAQPASGSYVAPTVLELGADEASLDNPVWREELFGPVLAMRRAADVQDAFRLANDSEFGLTCALFTQDVTRTLQALENIHVGVLHINSETAGTDPHVPFGGAKKSGYGPKEQGPAAREFFTYTTTAYVRGGRQ